MNEFEFQSSLESLKAALGSAPTVLLAWFTSLVFGVYNNMLLIVVPLVLIILDSLFAVVRVKLLHEGGFESRKFTKSVGKLILYYVAILSGCCIDALLGDAGIYIVCDHTISWTICAFLAIGEVVSILSSLVILFPNNLGAKLLLKVFTAEIASKLDKWGITDEYLHELVSTELEKKKK